MARSLVVTTELEGFCLLSLINLCNALTCAFWSGVKDFHSSAEYRRASGLKLLDHLLPFAGLLSSLFLRLEEPLVLVT